MARLRCLAGDYIAEKVARKGKLVLPGGDTAVFVPVVEEPLAVGRPAIPMTEAGAVRIEIAGVVLPVGSDCGPDRAAAIEDAAGRCAEGSAVIFPGQAVRIEIAVSPGDFRKGHDGLASMAQAELGFAPKAGVMVVFRSKRGDPLPGNRCLQR